MSDACYHDELKSSSVKTCLADISYYTNLTVIYKFSNIRLGSNLGGADMLISANLIGCLEDWGLI